MQVDLALWAAENFSAVSLAGAGSHGVVFRATCTHTGFARALKFFALTDCEGRALPDAASIAFNELAVNTALKTDVSLSDCCGPFPWMVQSVRGTADLFLFMHPDVRDRLDTRLRGIASYAVMVMPAAECNLTQFLAQCDASERERTAEACMLLVLLQLCVLKMRVPGFRHRDVKTDNILMWRQTRAPAPRRYQITEDRVVCVPLEATNHFLPSLSDFGLSALGVTHVPSIDTDFIALVLAVQPFIGPATRAELAQHVERADFTAPRLARMQCFQSYITLKSSRQ